MKILYFEKIIHLTPENLATGVFQVGSLLHQIELARGEYSSVRDILQKKVKSTKKLVLKRCARSGTGSNNYII